ncbi:hypothetical protein A3D77_06025 [Candidatus Gottesmanbacteria bacterium RIFCSPHIGHO2_02_FULL_39_11]|uniref:SUF system FeS cluster assembly SufBD core domain-containing protein n=1 Tax=Candidatus Gottesmanbacteria bacterium RIFCSPHIGHO2_02_FULL_39_11 TaxID=1798382 RepID=A0A1F5ZX64_9BACT|nr:MAG: hypothetical protein A3D77_06025 [Candidatus Gottesmanbacteria bacterium RIFCSPHIGHO2_02_FULL_39_11]
MKAQKFVLVDSLKSNQTINVLENEKKTVFILLTSGESQDGHVQIDMKGKNSSAQILGVVIGSGKQIINLHTFQDHMAGESQSDLLIKSVLFDCSKFNYEGLIRIEKDAQRSNAYQKNQNLLLSESSWANSQPKLEILANDVRCTHGATIGQINPEQMYYLKTRGLTDASAKKILVEGFIQDVVGRIEDEDIKKKIYGKIETVIRSKL